jgi:hypothetical protein
VELSRATGSRRVASKDAPLTAGSNAVDNFAEVLDLAFKTAEGDRRTSGSGSMLETYIGRSVAILVCLTRCRFAAERCEVLWKMEIA